MLIFEEITLKASNPLFKSTQSKHIRFSYNSVTAFSKKAAKFITSQELTWTQNIEFPLLYNKEIMFQILDKNNFGSNPQELRQLFKGKFILSRRQTFIDSIEVFRENGEKVGILQLKLRINSIIAQQVEKIMPKDQKFSIKSLIAHLLEISHRKVYIAIKLGSVHRQTPIIKSRGGEIVFLQGMEIDKSSFTKEAIFEIFSIEAKENQVKLIASGILQFDGIFIQQKVVLKNFKGDQVGDLLINGRLVQGKDTTLQAINSPRQMPNSINVDRLSHYQPQSQLMSRISSFRSRHSVDASKLSSSQSSKILNSSRVSRDQMKKVTIMHENKEIFFPKEKRFESHQDTPSQFISYLNERDDLIFKEKQSGRFYRGASIGYGDKTNFAQKDSPGVGKYKLPSIWDRY